MSLPNYIEIFSENFLTQHCTITESGDNPEYMYDQNPNTTWLSTSALDSTDEQITIVFKDEAGTETSKTFGTLIIQNTNVEDFTFEYHNGSTFVEISSSAITSNTDENVIVDFASSVSASQIRITLSDTMVADNKKQIGQLRVCKHLIDMDTVLTNFNRQNYSKQGHYYLNSGNLFHWKEFEKIKGKLKLSNLTLTKRNTLKEEVSARNSLTIIFYRDFDDNDIFEFAVIASVYEWLDRKTQLFELELSLSEK